MKKLLLLTMAMLLLSGSVYAQETIEFTGATYRNGEFGMTVGLGLRLSKDIWNLDYVTVNRTGEESVGIEMAYIRSYDDGGFYYGVLGGVGSDWVPKEGYSVNYILESAGGIVGYKSLYGWAKYRQQLEKESNYENNFAFGFGFKGKFL